MGRAIVSMLRIWLVRISPVIGRPGGRTTLVGNGRTRDVIGQTMAKPVFSVKRGRRDHKSWPPADLFPALGRVEVGPDQIAVAGYVGGHRHSSTTSRPTSGPQSKAPA